MAELAPGADKFFRARNKEAIGRGIKTLLGHQIYPGTKTCVPVVSHDRAFNVCYLRAAGRTGSQNEIYEATVTIETPDGVVASSERLQFREPLAGTIQVRPHVQTHSSFESQGLGSALMAATNALVGFEIGQNPAVFQGKRVEGIIEDDTRGERKGWSSAQARSLGYQELYGSLDEPGPRVWQRGYGSPRTLPFIGRWIGT